MPRAKALLLPIALEVPPPGSRDRIRHLHHQLQSAIADGRLCAGLRLPATRRLAKDLGVSRKTVLAAYDLLQGQGFLSCRAGSGAYVASDLPKRTVRKKPASVDTFDPRLSSTLRRTTAEIVPSSQAIAPPRYNFRVGAPDDRRFPFDIWARLSTRVLRAMSRGVFEYGGSEGRPALREAIANHVSFARAVACGPEEVVVTNGAQQAFDLIARILVTPGRTCVAVEEPGYHQARAPFTAAGANVVGVPVDHHGIIVEQIPEEAKIIVISPSHQFPLGVAMSMDRRAAILALAERTRAVIVEDDYDGEFRFGGRPLDALQTLDRSQSVIYVGSFSKSLFPSLRLGFVLTPLWARSALIAAKRMADWRTALLPQETLAAFIGEGHLTRHVRRIRPIYAERRTALQTAIAATCPDILDPIASDTGLHMSFRLSTGLQAEDVIAAGSAHGLRIDDPRRYFIASPRAPIVVFGIGMIEAVDIAPAIEELSQDLHRHAPRSLPGLKRRRP